MYQLKSRFDGSAEYYQGLDKELASLVEGEKNLIANLANLASWIFHSYPDLNWCGFYLWNEVDGELVLGPFQGKPACIRIRPGKGVCGTAYSTGKTLRVDDVHAFDGHIACDSASRSELVIPLIKKGIILGVLDLDSPHVGRFDVMAENKLTEIIEKITITIF